MFYRMSLRVMVGYDFKVKSNVVRVVVNIIDHGSTTFIFYSFVSGLDLSEVLRASVSVSSSYIRMGVN